MIKVNRGLAGIIVLCIAVMFTQSGYCNSFIDNVKGIFSKEKRVEMPKTEMVVVDTIADINKLSLLKNINSPLLSVKAKAAIVEKQQQLADKLVDKGYDASLLRDSEVVMVTIATEYLFAPNATVLMDGADKIIALLVEYAKVNGYYKVLLAMHSDDTGSDYYKNMLCNDRVEVVASIFDSTDCVVSYAMGDSNPLFDNNTVANRNANRRLEIYFVPYKVMIAKGEKEIL